MACLALGRKENPQGTSFEFAYLTPHSLNLAPFLKLNPVHIQCFFRAFQTNVLEPHPSLPVLATSGLDDEVKIWLPTNTSTLDWNEVEQVLY